MSNDLQARAWVEVDLDALADNYRKVREAVGAHPAIIAMVKADAYGLGAERVVRALELLQPWGYGVATADEGAALRDFGVLRPIVVFGPLPPTAVERAARAGLVATISDLPSLEQWRAGAGVAGQTLDFHVEIDTGMGRAGFDWRDTPEWGPAVQALAEAGDIRWTGVMTHFQGADSADATASSTQWARFEDALAQLPVRREDLMVHAANSAAALRWPEYAADAVRPGIFLYGGYPARDAPDIAPRPVVAVRARLVLVREVAPGSTVGYGATHVAGEWERWGTLAIGYGDGLPRRLGNCGSAIVRGRLVPFVGRISMDMTVVDITGVPDARAGDVATLIGSDGDACITLDDVAERAQTISYEILTGLRPRLPRVGKGAWIETS
jgi:alanine racemase